MVQQRSLTTQRSKTVSDTHLDVYKRQSLARVEDGKPQYEFVTCSVEPNEEAAEDQEIRDGLNLIATNSQREKTAWDKIEDCLLYT